MNWYRENLLQKEAFNFRDFAKGMAPTFASLLLFLGISQNMLSGKTPPEIKQTIQIKAKEKGLDYNKIAPIVEKNIKQVEVAPRQEKSQTQPVQNVQQKETKQKLDEIAWGNKVSEQFKQKVVDISSKLKVNPNYLMAAMAFETGGTFSASVRNAAGSGAVGLIQFMPSTSKQLGTSSKALAQMSPEKQLDYVYKYLQPYTGRLHTLEDVYMAILYPKAIGKPSDYKMFSKGKQYSQNAGLDINKDHVVTPGEAAAKVRQKLEQGQKFKG